MEHHSLFVHFQVSQIDLLIPTIIQGVFFSTGTPLKIKKKSTKKARLGVSRRIYVAVDSPNLGFPYFFRGVPVKKNTL